MTGRPRIGTWRSDEARQRFIELEDELWHEHWPEPPQAHDVKSFAGTTRLYHWPGPNGDPIVFLPGATGTALSWTPYVKSLPGRNVWALDTIGDVGRSVPRVPLDDSGGIARWLDETFAGAGIERAHLVGTSYGGFASLSLAIHEPARPASLTLIDPGGLAPLRLVRFMLWGMPMLFGVLAPAPIRVRLARTRPLLEDPRLMKMTLYGQRNHVTRTPPVNPFTEDELRSITAPTTVVIASRSAPFDPKIAADRAHLIPHATIDIIDAGHEVMWTHVDRCVAHVRRVSVR